jgi:hypothetical protein
MVDEAKHLASAGEKFPIFPRGDLEETILGRSVLRKIGQQLDNACSVQRSHLVWPSLGTRQT